MKSIKEGRKARQTMKKYRWYRYLFANGYVVIVRGMSKLEQKHLEAVNGKLVDKTLDGVY